MLAQVAFLNIAYLPMQATHKEVQVLHQATKHRLQVVQRRAKGNVLLRRRSLQKKRGIPLNHTPESWAAFNIANEFPYSTMFERYIC
jgi:hypothetical protein